MFRNAVQMSDDIDLWIDRTRSARFDTPERVRVLNLAQDQIVNDRIDNIRIKKPYSAQSNQRVREDLKAIIVKDLVIVPSGNIVPYPANYLYFDSLQTTVDGITSNCQAMMLEEDFILVDDPFEVQTPTWPRWVEGPSGLVVSHNGTNFTSSKLNYFKKCVSIAISTTTLTNTATLVAGDLMYVSSGSVVYNTITYSEGDTFTVILGNTSFTGTGTLIVIVNCELSGILHDEITQLAAAILIGNVENYRKSQKLESDSQRS